VTTPPTQDTPVLPAWREALELVEAATPGQWEIASSEHGVYIATTDATIAEIVTDDLNSNPGADATLIAAAPRLLKVLAEEVRESGQRIENLVEWQAALQKAVGVATLALDKAGISDIRTNHARAQLREFSSIDGGRTFQPEQPNE
jgi:hypothetical protein